MKINSEIFNQIYKEYSLLVYNLALNYVQNIEDAEEITQDVFVKIHHSWSKFNQDSTLKTWIYRITINESLNFINHKNTKKRLYIFGKKSTNEIEYSNASTFEHPGVLLENKENAKILYDTINQLPENQKTAFILSKVDGLTNPEISEIMKMSISAIEALNFRAKKSLQEKLAIKFDQYCKK